MAKGKEAGGGVLVGQNRSWRDEISPSCGYFEFSQNFPGFIPRAVNVCVSSLVWKSRILR